MFRFLFTMFMYDWECLCYSSQAGKSKSLLTKVKDDTQFSLLPLLRSIQSKTYKYVLLISLHMYKNTSVDV